MNRWFISLYLMLPGALDVVGLCGLTRPAPWTAPAGMCLAAAAPLAFFIRLTSALGAYRGPFRHLLGAVRVGRPGLDDGRLPLRQRAAAVPGRRRAGSRRTSGIDDLGAKKKPVFNIDIENCRKCGSAVKVIACIEDPVVIRKILEDPKEKDEYQDAVRLPESRIPYKRACLRKENPFVHHKEVAGDTRRGPRSAAGSDGADHRAENRAIEIDYVQPPK